MTDVELKAYIEALLDERDKRYDSRIDAAEKAVEKSERSVDRRFEYVNELRGALEDLSKTMLTRAEYLVAHRAVSDSIAKLEHSMGEVQSNAQRSVFGYIVGIIGLMIAAATAWWHKS